MLKRSFLFLQLFVTTCLSQSEKSNLFSFRLYDGNTTSNSGILQIHGPLPSSDWVYICPDYHATSSETLNFKSVVCRSLGYNSDASKITMSIVRFDGSSTSFLSFEGLSCSGTEKDLGACSYSYLRQRSDCHEGYQVTCPTCDTYEVRLTDGQIPSQGYVEICIDGTWSRICPSQWGYTNSFVVCQQLGFPATRPVQISETPRSIRHPTGFASSDVKVNCYGGEETLGDCNIASSSLCQLSYAFGLTNYLILQCTGENAYSGCVDNEVRLVGGEESYEGVVQVCRRGVWGTFSNMTWNSLDATVICRQLNLAPSNAFRVTIPNIFGRPGTGPIYSSPQCAGNETKINECRGHGTVVIHNSGHSSDATVRCHPTIAQASMCTDGDVRLVDGPTDYEGRVELCYNGVWGSICHSHNRNAVAAVVCRQLGYLGYDFTVLNRFNGYQLRGVATGPIHISGLECSGNEANLLQCSTRFSQSGLHICSELEDIAVQCDPRVVRKCTEGELRLGAGFSEHEGVPQVCISGRWVSACYDSWTQQNTDVFCKMLLQRTDIVTSYYECCGKTWNLVYSNFSARDITCSTPSPSKFLRDCSFTPVRPTCQKVIVGCYVLNNCTNGTIRLLSGHSPNQGVVQMCIDGLWGNIVGNSWSESGSRVVCRQLGLPWKFAVPINQLEMRNTGEPFLVSLKRCTGLEENFANCAFDKYYFLSRFQVALLNSFNYPASVSCQNNSPCTHGDLRLGNSTETNTRLEGRVEACLWGVWYVFCDAPQWGRNETATVCRQLLGQSAKASFRDFEKDYGPTNLSVIRGIQCNQDSTDIAQCSLDVEMKSYHYCSASFLLVSVVCEKDVVYEVKVITSKLPPYRIGQQLQAQCAISPQPPFPSLFYSWTVVNSRNAISSTSEGNASININLDLYHSGFIYCTVHVNGYTVTGYTRALVNGLLISNSSSPPPSDYIGQKYSFQVATPNSTGQPIPPLYNLNWFYNGDKIISGSDSTISDGNSTLVTVVKGGTYEVRYESLTVLPHDKTCNDNLLKFMRGYAGFSPTKFQVSSEDSSGESPKICFHVKSRILPFTDGDNFTINFDGRVPYNIDLKDVDIKLSHNSYTVENFMNYTISSGGVISGAYSIKDATVDHRGVFEVELLWRYEGKCPYYHSYLKSFLLHSFYGTTNTFNEIIMSKDYIEVVYYKSFKHAFSANTSALSSNEVAKLTCSATIVYPSFSSISIIKNNVTLARGDSPGQLVFVTNKTPKTPYGLYVCEVNASGVIFRKEVVIKEKAFGNVKIKLLGHPECKPTQELLSNLLNSTLSYLRRQCSCEVTKRDMQDAVITCKSSSLVQLNMTLEFSSDTGEESASTLARRLTGQVLMSDLFVYLDKGRASILSSCDVLDESAQDRTTLRTEDKPQTHAHRMGYYVGILVIAVIIGIVTSAFVTSAIIYGVIKYNNKPHTSNGHTRFENGPDNIRFSDIVKEEVNGEDSVENL